ncbi:Ig-like domain-containing protein [Actinokineospora terrae]|uniref:Ig-like domain (Group 3) n=1 Tax=Actinokineospora terrae TaxID=155974 RepID=A0A1H9WTQ1_9PSEU|nr:Ig-like domain-containing protein [Actinokineospora terrae]SES37330.1 Ig-like domain (group 3) [Actinokineospora terrae]
MRANSFARKLVGGAIVFAAATAATLGAAGIAAAAAPAGNLGTLSINKTTGLDTDAPTYTTSAGCTPDSDGYSLFVYGPGAWDAGFTATPVTDVGFSQSGGFPIVQGLSFKDIAVDNATTIVPGKYTVAAYCVDQFGASNKGAFTRDIWFTSATAWRDTDPNAQVATTTALSVSPAAPVASGTNVTLTANVTPATAAGTVQFKDGANNLGSPVTVVNGVATFSTTALAAGTRSLTASFSGAGFATSTSAAVSYVVNAPVAVPTTTALAVSPSGTAAAYSPVTLSATVNPGAAVGAVQFFDGANALGNPVAVSAGAATLTTSTLAVGAHSFTARFVPTNAANYATSVSVAVALDVTPFAGVTASETITTTVLAGELLISVANQNVVLPSPVMAADGSLLTTSGSLNPIKVTDTRAGNPGWNVSGQVSDFSNGANSINGANLGWTPKLVDKSAPQVIAVGAQVNPANAIAPGASAPNGLGLAAARVLATAAALGGNGTANLSADLALNVPTSTVAGTYSALLTLTAI